MSLPLLEALGRELAGAEISVLANSTNQALFLGFDNVSEVYCFDGTPFSIRNAPLTKQLRNWISRGDFDCVVIALGDDLLGLGEIQQIPIRVGAKECFLAPILTHTYSIGSPRTWGVEERLGALRCLGFQGGSSQGFIGENLEYRTALDAKLADNGIDQSGCLVSIHPFGSTQRQHWPLSQIEQLCSELQSRFGAVPIIIGGPDTRRFELVSKHDVQNSSYIDMRGKLSVGELIELLRISQLVISSDSGPMHISAAVGTKTIGLFRSSRPEHSIRNGRIVPIYGSDKSCKNGCTWDSCRFHPCRQMQSISTLQILEHATKVLDE